MSDTIPTSYDEITDEQESVELETPQEPQTEVGPEVAVETTVDEPTPVVEAESAPVEEPANDSASAPATALSKDVLRAVFNRRIVRYINNALWVAAVQAVKEGKAVTCTRRPPYLEISQSQFDPAVKKGMGSLNAIIARMI